ncbi:MAG TPA: hypothetical protein VL371_10490 [Gemmataceae bacterium]|jgi:hypothetical protein|nr:hypothetical protein [Gemmataceae bacterium]
MELQHVTYSGPPIDDEPLLARLPTSLADLLRQMNGFIQLHGGLHVRGACLQPAWHSLREAWAGGSAFHRFYPHVRRKDVPFAEDCMGDQFLLRSGRVYKLAAETGALEPMNVSLAAFFQAVAADPVEFLSLHPLIKFQHDGGRLEPGQLLGAFPPFCCKQSADGVSLAAIPTGERRRFLADLAAQVRDLPEGAEIEFEIAD